MNVALIIPTRGDRPKFLKQCHKLIAKQTFKPTHIIIIDHPAKHGVKDITERYRKGVEIATKKGCNCAVFWEDDDWYHPTYLEWLVKGWVKAKRPQVFGVGETYYYHIAAKARLYMGHPGRTSAFCTLVGLPYKGSWPHNNYAYLDMHFHKAGIVRTVPFPKGKVLAIGIKHGVGLTGGGGHRTRFRWDMVGNKARTWFVQNMNEELTFYDNLSKTLPKQQPAVLKSPKGVVTARKNTIKNGSKVIRKKIITIGPSTQLRRGGRKIIKIRRR